MSQTINTNVTSLFGQQSANKSTNDLRVAMARLSSGMRINTGKDDATGMSAAAGYEKTMRGALIAQRMANEGLAAAQTRDGYQAQVYENLQRIREIAVQSGGTASGTEFTVLAAENTRLLALATAQSAFVIDSAGTTYTGAQAAATITGTGAIATVNSDIDAVVAARAGYGADMGKFASASSALGLEASNAAGQYSSVMDTDYAVETTNMTRASIKNQAANAMLAQANQIPNQVLALLRF